MGRQYVHLIMKYIQIFSVLNAVCLYIGFHCWTWFVSRIISSITTMKHVKNISTTRKQHSTIATVFNEQHQSEVFSRYCAFSAAKLRTKFIIRVHFFYIFFHTVASQDFAEQGHQTTSPILVVLAWEYDVQLLMLMLNSGYNCSLNRKKH